MRVWEDFSYQHRLFAFSGTFFKFLQLISITNFKPFLSAASTARSALGLLHLPFKISKVFSLIQKIESKTNKRFFYIFSSLAKILAIVRKILLVSLLQVLKKSQPEAASFINAVVKVISTASLWIGSKKKIEKGVAFTLLLGETLLRSIRLCGLKVNPLAFTILFCIKSTYTLYKVVSETALELI